MKHFSILNIALAIMLLIAGCTPKSYATPTPTDTPVPQPSPTKEIIPDTPTPTLVPPTPTLIPISFSEGAEKGMVKELKRFGTGSINDAQYSPLGDLIAYATNIGVFVYDTQTFGEVGFYPSKSFVRTVAFTPDGKRIAYGSYGDVVLWDIMKNEQVKSFTAHAANLGAIAISPDGQFLASSGSNGKDERGAANEVCVWNTNDWSLVRTNSISNVSKLVFAPDSSMLFAVDNNRILTLVSDGWGMSGLIQELIPVGGNVKAQPEILDISISSDGNLLAVAYNRYNVIGLFNFPSTRLKQLILIDPDENQQPTRGGISSVSFSSTSEYLAFASHGMGVIKITGDKVNIFNYAKDNGGSLPGSFVRYSPKDNLLIYDLKVYNSPTLKAGDSYPIPTLGDAAGIFKEHAVFPSGNWKVEVDDENGIVALVKEGVSTPLYAVKAYTPTVLAIFGHRSYFTVGDIAIASDESFFVTGGYDGQVYSWQVAEEPDNVLLGRPGKGIHAIAISPDGFLVAAGDEDGRITIWDTSNGEPEIALELEHTNDAGAFSNIIYSMAFSPDGKVLVSGNHAGTIKIWRVSDGALLDTLFNNIWVEALQFSEDGTTLYSKSRIIYEDQGVVRWWGVNQ